MLQCAEALYELAAIKAPYLYIIYILKRRIKAADVVAYLQR